MIPYGRQDITEADIAAVVEVLRSDFLTQGPAVPRFEADTARMVGARHAVAVNSATSALHVACLALGLGEGDWLWTAPNTFVASANCARYCGARVDFVDIEADTGNMCVAALRSKLESAARTGILPKVVVPVHFGGQPTDQEAIWRLSQEYGFKVLEDASHSIGATRNGECVGSCRWAHIAVFSFHPVKVVTTAEGGAALTNDDSLAEKMALLRTHGVTRDRELMTFEPSGPWYYEQIALGFNYRMTDVQAALGSSQLTRLERYVQRRNELAARYDAVLRDSFARPLAVRSENRSAYHLYVVRLPPADHKRIFERLRARGIGVNLHYMPVHLQPYYRRLGFNEGDFPAAEAHGREAMSLPLFPALSRDEQARVIEELLASER